MPKKNDASGDIPSAKQWESCSAGGVLPIGSEGFVI